MRLQSLGALVHVPCLVLAIATVAAPLAAGELESDADTLLLLHFDGNLDGVDGETPTQATGVSFASGVHGQGARFQVGNQVYFEVGENLDPREGTLEFWIQPLWEGGDGNNRWVLRASGGGGILVGKDGGGYWRSIFNRYGSAPGGGEVGAGVNVDGWMPNEWHHAAFTWTSESLKVYVDGSLVDTRPVGFALPELGEDVFQLGADGEGGYVDAVIDELRISDVERTAEEIAASYTAGIAALGLVMTPDQADLLETWWWRPELLLMTAAGPTPLPPALASWSSSDESIAVVRPDGVVVATGPGEATITASYEGFVAVGTVSVTAPLLAPTVETIPPDLATPASGARHEIPVAILRYLPTSDGVTVDETVADWAGPLAGLKQRIETLELRVKFGLEEGSRFRGYAHPLALPALGYRVVKIITVYEPIPKSPFLANGNVGWYRPDYNQILERLDAESLVDNQGVKEIWLWGYHHAGIEPVESNMSSPVTGDISNSERYEDDLPIFDHTYTLYNYNFTRGTAEALHDHGHQLEALLGWANDRQDGNTHLFERAFIGKDENDQHITGRCGWTHMPPNTVAGYDYENPVPAESDCTDWTPDGSGETEWVSAETWGELEYGWPAGGAEALEGRYHAQFLVWWWQNMPGRDNRIAHGAFEMTDWWEFTADWDAAVLGGLGLYGDPVPPPARGDLSGNGRSDILLRSTDGAMRLWQMNGTEVEVSTDLPARAPDWAVAGVGDFDADGQHDVLWRNVLSGRTELWLMDGATIRESGETTVQLDTSWRIQGVGDLDGDDRADILWAGANGTLSVWLMEGLAAPDPRGLPGAPRRSQVVGLADVDADGRDDILWRDTRTGRVRLWLMAAETVRLSVVLASSVSPSWRIAGLGDLDGNGAEDILWHHSGGSSYAWLMAGGAIGGAGWLSSVSRTWIVGGLGDFDGDGRDDIVWRRKGSGATYLWLMDGTRARDGGAPTEQVSPLWAIASPWALAEPPEDLGSEPAPAARTRRSF